MYVSSVFYLKQVNSQLDGYALVLQKESIEALAERVRKRLAAAEQSEKEFEKWLLHVVEGAGHNNARSAFHAPLGDQTNLANRCFTLEHWLRTVICTCARRSDGSSGSAACAVHQAAYLQVPHAAPSMSVAGSNYIFLALEHPAPPGGTGGKRTRFSTERSIKIHN